MFRQNNNRRNNNARNRAPRNNRRRPNVPARSPATGPGTVVQRTANRIGRVSLTQTNPNGGTILFSTLAFQLADLQGSDTLVNSYEQYRVRKIDVFMKPDITKADGLASADRLVAIQSALNTTTIYSYVDYDTLSVPTEQTILGRDSLKIRALDPHAFRKIASFTPRTKNGDTGVVYPASTWYSTENANLRFLGLAFRATQDSSLWGTTASDAAAVTISYKYHLEFRGLKAQP